MDTAAPDAPDVRQPAWGSSPPKRRLGRWSLQASPVKMNYMTLGNTVPHLHTHVVPRYQGDPAPGGPIAWQDIFSPDPVPDADLHRQASDLRALLDR